MICVTEKELIDRIKKVIGFNLNSKEAELIDTLITQTRIHISEVFQDYYPTDKSIITILYHLHTFIYDYACFEMNDAFRVIKTVYEENKFVDHMVGVVRVLLQLGEYKIASLVIKFFDGNDYDFLILLYFGYMYLADNEIS